MKDWLKLALGESTLPPYVSSFAKKASGSSASEDDEDDDEEDDDEEDDDDDDDPDADKSDDEIRAELKATRERLAKANASSKKRRLALRKEREEAAAKKPKAKKSDEDDDDREAAIEAARAEGTKAGTDKAKFSEAKASLIAAGVPKDRAARAAKMLDLEDLDLDDDGELDGIEDAIDALKADMPEFFSGSRRRRGSSLPEKRDRDGEGGKRKERLSTSEMQARRLTGAGR